MRPLSLALLTLLAVGCPTNDSPPGGAPGAAGGVPPVGDPNAQPGPPPGDPGATPPGETPPGGVPADAGAEGAAPGSLQGPPGFASLITDGKSITITGTVTGAEKGDTVQVDFTRVKDNNGAKSPEAIEVVKVTDGKFSVKAPATLDGEIWVTAAVLDDKGTPTPKGGVASAPVKLEGKDVTVAIAISSSMDWVKTLPWFDPNAPKPADGVPTAPGTPPGGAPGAAPTDAAGAPPAGGAAPAGAPPAGGAAPAGAPPAGGSAPAAPK